MHSNLLNLIISVAIAVAAWLSTNCETRAQTAPTITNDYVLLSNNSANDSYLATGDFYLIQAQLGADPVISTSPSFASTVYGYVSQGTTNEALFTKPYAVNPSLVAASVPYSTSLSGAWTMTLSSTPTFSPGTVTTVTTNSLVGAIPMNFVQSMTITPGTTPLTPTITWVDPTSGPSINEVRITVTDNSTPIQRFNIDPNPSTNALVPYGTSYSQGDRTYNSVQMAGSATSFAIPSTNDNSGNVDYGSPVLQYGHTYTIGIDLENADGPKVSGCSLCNIATRSQSFFDYTPINPQSLGLPPTAVINLPTTTPVPTTTGLYSGPVYSFNAPIVSGGVTYIDPVVADGFLYTIGAGDPNFASVDPITDVGSGIYQLWVWNGTGFVEVDSALAAGTTFDFLTNGYANGVSEFEILGIDPSAGLDPTDITAFVTGLTFTGDGTFTGTMQALTEVTNTPLPPSWVLMLTSLIGCGLLASRRKRRDGPAAVTASACA